MLRLCEILTQVIFLDAVLWGKLVANLWRPTTPSIHSLRGFLRLLGTSFNEAYKDTPSNVLPLQIQKQHINMPRGSVLGFTLCRSSEFNYSPEALATGLFFDYLEYNLTKYLIERLLMLCCGKFNSNAAIYCIVALQVSISAKKFLIYIRSLTTQLIHDAVYTFPKNQREHYHRTSNLNKLVYLAVLLRDVQVDFGVDMQINLFREAH